MNANAMREITELGAKSGTHLQLLVDYIYYAKQQPPELFFSAASYIHEHFWEQGDLILKYKIVRAFFEKLS